MEEEIIKEKSILSMSKEELEKAFSQLSLEEIEGLMKAISEVENEWYPTI